jgi:hypothetical protein
MKAEVIHCRGMKKEGFFGIRVHTDMENPVTGGDHFDLIIPGCQYYGLAKALGVKEIGEWGDVNESDIRIQRFLQSLADKLNG